MFFSVSLKFSLLAILTTFIPATQAHPFTGEAASWESLSADVFNTSNIEPRQNRKPEWLRIMPLGASITRGVGSSPEDGYRKPLRDRLRSLGYKVNMVGSQSNPQGSMTNGAHEGHSGHLIRQAYDNMDNSIGKKPNLVLINVGTNDCNQNVDINGAVQRLTDVVDKVFRESQRATVILSTLLINRGNSDANGRVSFVNQGIRRMVYEKRQDGQRIVLADMNDGKFITAGDLSDDLHPTNDGYRKMAAVWDAAIGKAVEEGKVQDPEDTGIPDEGPGNDCKKVAGDGKGPVKMQQGSGEDDGQYRHKSTGMGVIWSSDDRAPLALVIGFEFAQIVNALGNPAPDGVLDDIVVFVDKSRSTTSRAQVLMYTNLANGKFDDGRQIYIPDYGPCGEDFGFFWSEINNDLLDDFVCIGREGNMYVALNRGSTDGKPKFEYIGMYFQAPSGYEQDGDGKADFLWVDKFEERG